MRQFLQGLYPLGPPDDPSRRCCTHATHYPDQVLHRFNPLNCPLFIFAAAMRRWMQFQGSSLPISSDENERPFGPVEWRHGSGSLWPSIGEGRACCRAYSDGSCGSCDGFACHTCPPHVRCRTSRDDTSTARDAAGYHSSAGTSCCERAPCGSRCGEGRHGPVSEGVASPLARADRQFFCTVCVVLCRGRVAHPRKRV